MKRVIKVFLSKDIMCPLISALGAFISAIFAGCKLCASDISVEVSPYGFGTNTINEVIR